MSQVNRHKQLVISLAILVFLLIVSIVVILYAKGYRFGLSTGKLEFSGTGLLVVESTPDGAQVFINGHLTTATDNTLNLAPGDYDVKIFKQGYFSWEKKVKIQKEVVAKESALLFATTPKLESLTDLGVDHPVIDPTFSRIAYTVASGSARKNGVYVLDMSTRPILTLQNSATQLADDTVDAFSKAILSWSPDGKQLLASVSARQSQVTNYLLNSDGFNQNPVDVTETMDTVKTTWTNQAIQKDQARATGLKKDIKNILNINFNIISWSPDETKILYVASQSGTLPIVIKPRLVGIDSTPEMRTIEKSSVYVYDIKEDKNYKIAKQVDQDCLNNPAICHQFSWFPDSAHILYVNPNHSIQAIEFDGTNSTTLYAGPFMQHYVFPWPSGVKVVIVTNLDNLTIPPNLYTVGFE